MLMLPVKLPQHSLYMVAYHGIAYLATDRDTQTSRGSMLASLQYEKVRSMSLARCLGKSEEFRTLSQALSLGKR